MRFTSGIDSKHHAFFEKSRNRFQKNTVILFFLFFLCLSGSLFAQNPIVTENSNPGNPQYEWDGVYNAGSTTIQGFATDMSVNKGQTIRFKVDVNTGSNKNFNIKIFRLGYYGGNGARLIADLGTFTGIDQPDPIVNTAVGLVDCGNWTENASWAVPADAVSGIYMAKLDRATGGVSHITFVVRDDSRSTDLLFKTSDATWQAYNNYGGPSLYGGGSTSFPIGRASKVSYNRPFNTRAGDGRAENFVLNAEFAMLQWLERNGYDVSYATDVDFERDSTPITPSRHKVIMSVGHDEYWSKNERDRVEAARDAGVHLAFFSGNEVYWKTRFENSTDASDQKYRTLVVYKEGLPSNMGEFTCGTMNCDPLAGVWTGLWRFGGSEDAGRPENGLSGQTSWLERSIPLVVPETFKNLRFWRNTEVATLSSGGSASLGPKILGYEWDYEQEKFRDQYPKGRVLMSSTSITGDGNCCAFQDNGNSNANFNTENGRVYTHKLSLYRHSSGALVFGAGTINWSWGLEGDHDVEGSTELPAIQQATVNLFAEMDVQPATLQSGLVLASNSNDNTAPGVVITSPVTNTNVGQGKAITITGTATETGGGVVAGVEVSIDGGVTWNVADVQGVLSGTVNWSYSFIPSQLGNFEVRARSFDDLGNLGVAGPAPTPGSIILNGTCPCSVFSSLEVPPVDETKYYGSDASFGMKFRTSTDGYIAGVRFYKDASNNGTHIGKIWSSTGTLLRTATFVNETASGWQTITFSSPLPITANTTYIVSYYSSNGVYSVAETDFTNSIVRGPITALQDGLDGQNGLYASGDAFPNNSFNKSNYLVDAVFTTEPACLITGTLQTFGQICSEQQISLRFNNPTGQAPYSLNLNGNVINNINSNVAFGTNIIANNLSLVNISIWPSSAIGGAASSDATQREVGVKFRSSVQGVITAIRFYKTAESGTGTFPVRLYDLTTGDLVNGFSTGSITITNEGVSGWQQATLNAAVPILPNRTYVATYVAQNGRYAESPSDLNIAETNGPLTALADNTDGPNGIYKTGSGSGVPTESDNNGTNYWVDVVFTATNQIRLTEIVDNYGNTCFANNPNIQTLDLQPVNCLLLPVTFQEFSLSVRNNDINLFWSTASESNNKGFQIQRSLDGNNWINIGFVNGAGNSQTLKKYQYPDRGLKDGRYFYRLKQFDLNGDFKFSKVISASITNKLSYVLGQNYPNPARQNTTISYSVPVKSPVEMALYDMQGRQVKMLVNEIKESGTYTIDLDTRKLSKGVYHYKMKSGNYSDVKRLLVE